MMIKKADIKHILGEVPLTAEFYWQIRQAGKPISKNFSMRQTGRMLPEWVAQAKQVLKNSRLADGKHVLIFATLRYWIEHAALMGVALAGQGHQISLAYLPYANWHAALNRFDIRRNNAYAKSILVPAADLIDPVSFLDRDGSKVKLPSAIKDRVQELSIRDVQYTHNNEHVDADSQLYKLRTARNTQAAKAALAWLEENKPDVLVTPNGSILEMGAVYQVARYMEIPVVTYEFGEQHDRIWLALNAEVMKQDTSQLWDAKKNTSLTDHQRDKIRQLYDSRRSADLWENFSRRWQGVPGKGGEKVRHELGLDARPVILLAANVIGDSLTLGRQVFTESMTEWLKQTTLKFAQRSDAQLVVRIHPGERYIQGPSVADVINSVLPTGASNIHLVPADAPVNTYDLVEFADLGLVYTTTVGMEMAMSGVPVIVIGETHYRGKGFTLDPASWESYEEMLDRVLTSPAEHALSRQQVDQAWNYAYRFYFDYPMPFPWHLLNFREEIKTWPVSRALSREGQEAYGETFRLLVGQPRDWNQTALAEVINASSPAFGYEETAR